MDIMVIVKQQNELKDFFVFKIKINTKNLS